MSLKKLDYNGLQTLVTAIKSYMRNNYLSLNGGTLSGIAKFKTNNNVDVTSDTRVEEVATQGLDKNNVIVGQDFYSSYATENFHGVRVLNPDTTTGGWADLRVRASANGKSVITFDRHSNLTDGTSDNTTNIPTTKWLHSNYLPLSGGAMTGDISFTPSGVAKDISDWTIIGEPAKMVTSRFGIKGTPPSSDTYFVIQMPIAMARDNDPEIESLWSDCEYGGLNVYLWPDGGVNTMLTAYKNDRSVSTPITLKLDYPGSNGGQTMLNFDGQKIDFPAIWTSSVDLLVRPKTNGTINLGNGSYRWKQLFATTTTISTSDERLKDNITNIPNEVLDVWEEVNWYQFQFKDAIEEKGENARIHNGLIAQRIKSVFESHNLDAFRYGLLCYDEWDTIPAEYDKATGEIKTPALEAGNQYSLRYEEALCMEAAYQRRKNKQLEDRIKLLEEKLENI